MAERMKNIAASLIMVAFIIPVLGCSDKDMAARKPAAEKPSTAAPAPPATQKEEPKVEKEVYVYDARNRRDPFTSLIAVAKEKPQRLRKANPVENYDVDEIKLSAIIWDSRQYYALISLPDGKSYTIKKGMTLGIYGGKAAEITKDSVIITEQVKDFRGHPKTKDTTLKLRKEGEE